MSELILEKNVLPKDWIEVDFPDVVFFQEGPGLRSFQFTDQGMKVINVTNIVNGKLDLSNTKKYISMDEFKKKYSHFAVEENDIVMASSGATFGKMAIVSKINLPLMMNTSVIRIHPLNPNNLDRKFLKYFLQSELFKKQIRKFVTGSAQPNFGPTHLNKTKILITPLNKQKQIGNKIDNLFLNSNLIKKKLNKNLNYLLNFKNSVLQSAFTGNLVNSDPNEIPVNVIPKIQKKSTGKKATTNIIMGKYALSVGKPDVTPPKNWKWVPLLHISELASGHTPKRQNPNYWNGKIPWITGSDAGKHDGSYIVETKEYITHEGVENSGAVVLPKNTVCLAREASIGYCVLLGKPMATNQRFVNFICGKNILPKYLMYLFLFERNYMYKFKEGSIFGTIYFPSVKAFHVCLPPINEQKRIVEKIDNIWSLSKKIEHDITSKFTSLESFEKSVLKHAFEGKLVPQDPKDESVEILLQKIKHEKEQLKQKTSRKSKNVK
jgi:type I restriction enzyme, S subunit